MSSIKQVIEILASSDKSFEDALQRAVAQLAELATAVRLLGNHGSRVKYLHEGIVLKSHHHTSSLSSLLPNQIN